MSIASSATPVYYILLKLQDTICKSPPLRILQQQQQQQESKARHSNRAISPVRQKSKNSTLACLLQSEQKHSRSTLAQSQRREIIEIVPSTEHVRISSSTGSCVSSVSSKQQQQQQPISQEVSELEEDEVEESGKRKVMHVKTWRKKGQKYYTHHKQETRR